MLTSQAQPPEAAARRDVEDMRAHIQKFVRGFGLLVTRQTPCGFPISPSYAHALMLLRFGTDRRLVTSEDARREPLSPVDRHTP